MSLSSWLNCWHLCFLLPPHWVNSCPYVWLIEPETCLGWPCASWIESWSGGSEGWDLAPCQGAATDRTFVSSAVHHWGRFSSSLAEKRETNRKELSPSLQLGFSQTVSLPRRRCLCLWMGNSVALPQRCKKGEPEHGTASPSLKSVSLFLDWHWWKHWVSP